MKKKLIPLCSGAVLGLELALLVDALVVFGGSSLAVREFALIWTILTLAMVFLLKWRTKRILAMACVLLLIPAVILGCGYVGARMFFHNAEYSFSDSGKAQMYADRRVMLVVPHQDDEINILGGVMEEYVRYGSELYAVYITNGDYYGLAEVRHREALALFEDIGVPEDHVIFLGYGDQWAEGGPHLYNAEPGVVMVSAFGRTETYGTQYHDAYREGREYTAENLVDDLKSVIQEYRPDVLFCSDYDQHTEHKATTLLFDRVMGLLLKEDPSYQPVVYKAYAYSTAWLAEKDYYADNILSTQDPFSGPQQQEPEVYRWEERIRLPIDGSTVSRSMVSSEAFRRLKLHASQTAEGMANGVVNGDKVAWQRHTDSLCLYADIQTSSGVAALVNDFMLTDNYDVTDKNRMPYDGVWIPETGDSSRTVQVELETASDISSVVLYDHPSQEHNVRNARITFADGTVVETGALDPKGAATRIPVNVKNVSSFTVSLLETEGELAGLSELEAFAQDPQPEGSYLKLMDQEGNFLYDYWLPEAGSAELELMLHGDLPEWNAENYSITTEGSGTAVLEEGKLLVSCPRGESFILTVSCKTTDASDRIVVRNPFGIVRSVIRWCQQAEMTVYPYIAEERYRSLMIPGLIEKVKYILDRMV